MRMVALVSSALHNPHGYMLQLTRNALALAPKVHKRSSASKSGNVWLCCNNGGQLRQCCAENFTVSFPVKNRHRNTEHSAVICGDGKQMCFWKPSTLVPFIGDLVPPMIECNILKGLFTLFISSCVLQTKRACGLLYENRAWPNVAWRPWWIHIDGKAASEAQQPWFFHKPPGTRSQSADRC